MKDELQKLKEQVKENISTLVANGKLQEAQQLLNQYAGMAKDDIEVFSIQAIIAIHAGQLAAAQNSIETGLKIDKSNFDLLYNLAYVFELQQKYAEAASTYLRLSDSIYSGQQQALAQGALERISEYAPELTTNRQKIAFFVKPDMDSFLTDIIDRLADQYETKKIIVTNQNQIDEGMQEADICWFEWCDELVIYGSKLGLAKEKKIICRLHSYEAFTEYPMNVDWNTVDQVIFVAEHIRDTVLENAPSLAKEKTVIVPNGIILDHYNFKNRKPGFKIAYVGYINYKKGPMLLLHTFKALYDKDRRYQLYIAGTFQDGRDVLYFRQMLSELGLNNNVFYEGWQSDINTWLDDKDYIICTSVLEGHPVGIMEGMAKGIKPLIHNFVGARKIFPQEYIWNTINECVKQIRTSTYSSGEYRKVIQDEYSKQQQIEKILAVIIDLSDIGTKVSGQEADHIGKNHEGFVEIKEKTSEIQPEKRLFPKVSVIISTDNRKELLEQALESVLAQDYENLEVVVSDKDSTDGTVEMMEDFMLDKRIKYHRNEANITSLENYCHPFYKSVTGEYTLILSDDECLVDDNYISKAINLVEKDCSSKKKTNTRHEPLVTIGITNYNAIQYVEECLKSIFTQTYRNLEIVVVDDKSTDGSLKVLHQYANKHVNMKLVEHKGNSGSPDLGRQEIIDDANGKYFMLFDSDDYFADKEAIAKFVAIAEKNVKFDYIYCNLQVVNEKSEPMEIWKAKQYDLDCIIHDTFRRGGSGILNMKGLFKTEFFRKNRIEYLSNGTAGDTLTLLSCMKKSMDILHVDQALIAYRQHANNFTFDIEKRVFSVLNNMEYIISNFDRTIYFPESNWSQLNDAESQAAHAFLVAKFYYSIFTQYYSGNGMPWGDNSLKDDHKMLEYLMPLRRKIIYYVGKGAGLSTQYDKELNDILIDFNKIYSDNNKYIADNY